MNAPDMVAWQFFLQVNAGAATAGNNNALFETWANDGDTFRTTPVWPSKGMRVAPAAPRALLSVHQALEQTPSPPRGMSALVLPPRPGDTISEETRRNYSAFEFIVHNGLYKVSGLQAAFGGKPISFPPDAIEVKANWAPVCADSACTKSGIPGYTGDPKNAASLYHVNTASNGKQYALLAMHVISKIVPNWTWATFEHQNNPGRCDIIGCSDAFGAQQAYVAPNQVPNAEYPACTKTSALQALFAGSTVDKADVNYCLKGSQTDFTDATGLAVRLGNSVTEAGFVQQASCMTCHARAAFDAGGAATTGGGFDKNGTTSVGALQPSWFWSTQPPNVGNPPLAPPSFTSPTAWSNQIAQAADFVWSIPFCAIDDTAAPPQTVSKRCANK
jgi:hypothetical protein